MSILDLPAISGSYLFPQPRTVKDGFAVEVDGATLQCFHQVLNPTAKTVLHFHGNGEAVADYVPDHANLFEDMGLNSLFVEYREYGGSTGQAQLVAMLGDGEAVLKSAGLDPGDIIVFGRSIGSLYAIELASRCPTIAGLIIESGIADPLERFLTYADLKAASIDPNDVHNEVKLHFDHQRKLQRYSNPLLVLHTENDGLVDISHAERIHEWAASTEKKFVRFPNGNHNSIFIANAAEYVDAVAKFANRSQVD